MLTGLSANDSSAVTESAWTHAKSWEGGYVDHPVNEHLILVLHLEICIASTTKLLASCMLKYYRSPHDLGVKDRLADAAACTAVVPGHGISQLNTLSQPLAICITDDGGGAHVQVSLPSLQQRLLRCLPGCSLSSGLDL